MISNGSIQRSRTRDTVKLTVWVAMRCDELDWLTVKAVAVAVAVICNLSICRAQTHQLTKALAISYKSQQTILQCAHTQSHAVPCVYFCLVCIILVSRHYRTGIKIDRPRSERLACFGSTIISTFENARTVKSYTRSYITSVYTHIHA